MQGQLQSGKELYVYIRSVPKNVATNPIARAVARQKLRHKLVDQKIALYLMNDGDDCVELLEGLGTTLAIIGMAAEMEPKIQPDDQRLRILRGGLSACQQLIKSGKFDKSQTVSICRALDEAEGLNVWISAASIQKAIEICQGQSLQSQP